MGVNPSIGLSFEYLRTVVSYVIIIMRSAVVVEAAKTAQGEGGCHLYRFRLAVQALIAVQVLVIAMEV